MRPKHELLMLMAMSEIIGKTNQSIVRKLQGREYTQQEPTENQRRIMKQDATQIQPLHKFIIKGCEVWARNKKDALKQVNKR